MTTMELELSEDQQRAHDEIIDWVIDNGRLMTLGGYAGTGKSTITGKIIETLKYGGVPDHAKPSKIAFCCYTGKAADVLKGKLKDANAYNSDLDYCGTIHRLIYKPVFYDGELHHWEKVETLEYDLIVIDEASMVTLKIFEDLKSYNLPILAVGDHGQLPPVKDDFNLMEKPKIRLEKIHRVAEGNPIIKVSLMARQTGHIPIGNYGNSEQCVKKITDWSIMDKDEIENPDEVMIICGFNQFRVLMNQSIRFRMERLFPDPIKGDRVICLRNNANAGIFNGMRGTLKSIKEYADDTYLVSIDMDEGFIYSGQILKEQFNQPTTVRKVPGNSKDNPIDLFDYGYALTCHKAQGSECPRVVVFEQRSKFMDDEQWRRWLYTAVSRSSKNLIIVGK